MGSKTDKERQSFVFYVDWYEMIEQQPEQIQLVLYKSIMHYVFNGEEPTEPLIKMAFTLLKGQIDRDMKKYDEKIEKRREAGRKGAEVTNQLRWGQQMSAKSANDDNYQQMSAKSAKSALNDNSNYNVNSNDNDLKKPTNVGKEIAASAAALDKRKEAFYQELIPWVQMYGKQMIREFYDYWTEPNKSKTRFRKEMERTWDMSRRLKVWAEREKSNPKDVVAKEQTQSNEKHLRQVFENVKNELLNNGTNNDNLLWGISCDINEGRLVLCFSNQTHQQKYYETHGTELQTRLKENLPDTEITTKILI